jgi:regulator of protease activity HflC (stomatin/prohibitin superfamily)
MDGLGAVLTVVLIGGVLLVSGLKVLREYERAVVFRLGRLVACRGPGVIYVIPVMERMVRVALRTITLDIPPQDVISRDNVSLKVSAVLYFRVLDPNKATVEIENYLFATSQLAQSTLRSVCGQAELNQTTGDWHRGTLLEIWALPGGLRSKRPPEAAKLTEFVTQLLFPSSRELTGCHRSVRMSCGLI